MSVSPVLTNCQSNVFPVNYNTCVCVSQARHSGPVNAADLDVGVRVLLPRRAVGHAGRACVRALRCRRAASRLLTASHVLRRTARLGHASSECQQVTQCLQHLF
jgi:hypothetical protein